MVYDCKNEKVTETSNNFYAKINGFKNFKDMTEHGMKFIGDMHCTGNYDSTCPYCAFELIFDEHYER